MDRRYFFKALASGLVAVSSPGIFLPKLIKPAWKRHCFFPGVGPLPLEVTFSFGGKTFKGQLVSARGFGEYALANYRRISWD